MEVEITTEEKILIAARKVFIEKGWDGARMQEIADNAGINKALLHYYFRNKEQLFKRVFAGIVGKLIPNLNTIIQSEQPIFEKIQAFTDAYIDFLLANQELPLFVANELSRNANLIVGAFEENGLKPMIGKMVMEIFQAIENKQIRPINPAHLLMNIVSMCVFPFMGRSIFQKVLMQVPEEMYQELLKQRKKEIYEMVYHSIVL
ncbi:TetR/AcrR family transcriptional regulator [Flectobacillus roseus]|uniref:TetR/AcrR family transcriptional regulator n=1 Tax=Flectobacillus roseus TaxID=502259 RepID=A0ABT6Y5H1_9BACT|nr:TetR/AcrR family transcriptional regulator [Flectobacillus roseus]MDI9858521.1 TetR/AcrR family transcriptional regulator [Flectobacillus roseus]